MHEELIERLETGDIHDVQLRLAARAGLSDEPPSDCLELKACRAISELQSSIEALAAENARVTERLQAIIDWADLALANPAEFDSHGVKNLAGPVFDEARAALTQQGDRGE
jgi:nucleoside 2-deoxyribosyltransferase